MSIGKGFKMKKNIIRDIVTIVVLAIVSVGLISCGKTFSGEYYSGDKTNTQSYTSYVFSGDKVTVSEYLAGYEFGSYEAEYVIKGGNITLTWTDANGETKTKTQTFEELKDGSIRIGVVTYKKAEK